MQESRLFKIIYYLLDKGHATAPELAAKFEVSVRTIYRDIDALSGAGIPVYAETGRNGGIYLMNDFVLDRAVLSEREKQESPSRQEEVSVMLRFPKEMAYRIYDEFDKSQVERQENGDFLVSAQMPEDGWLIGFLLSFGPQVEILSPANLRDVVAEQARLIYEKNKP